MKQPKTDRFTRIKNLAESQLDNDDYMDTGDVVNALNSIISICDEAIAQPEREMDQPETELPYETLMETTQLIVKARINFLDFGSYPTEEEVKPYDRAVEYLMHISQLYFECAGCGRMVAPDEDRYQDPATENWYCIKCLDEGI